MRALTARGAFDVDTTTLEANYVAVSFPAPRSKRGQSALVASRIEGDSPAPTSAS